METSCAPSGFRPHHNSRLHNRVDAVMNHVSRYQFEGRARLATDVGVSRSTISRMLNGQTTPSYALVQKVTAALSRHLGRPLAPNDLFSPSGFYEERSACRLSGYRGYLPEQAFDGRGRRRPEWRDARPGDWSLAPEPETSALSLQP
jgi:transcriptional regulator with XRE-family HTH domain